ncbi:MAG: transposase, partial [Deltaproteobacteria bacterium]|nr:transposase [Deltaproteobacteria bacterium]
MGVTKGFGKLGKGFVFHGHQKDLYVYVMNRRFKRIFRPDVGRLVHGRMEALEMMNGQPVHFEGILDKIGVSALDGDEFNELLLDHLNPYLGHLSRRELREHMVVAIKGLLSDLDRKSMEPMA